jgi:hypothetical protein
MELQGVVQVLISAGGSSRHAQPPLFEVSPKTHMKSWQVSMMRCLVIHGQLLGPLTSWQVLELEQAS